MSTTTLSLLVRNLSTPDQVRQFPNAKAELVELGDTSFVRLTLQPGWKWSKDIKPSMNTDSCQASHVQYVVSGRLRITMDNGTTVDLKPGDAASIPPGHDAYVVGNEPFVAIDLGDVKNLFK